jgi:hypothetical protein
LRRRSSGTKRRSSPAHAVREEQHGEHDRPDDEHAFDPEVRADVVLADREREADRRKRQRGDAAERALEARRSRSCRRVGRLRRELS